jgi:hypothetical protein
MNEKEFDLKKAAKMLSIYLDADISESDVSSIVTLLKMTRKKTNVVPAPPDCKEVLELVKNGQYVERKAVDI